jgi:hypothetical protein
MGFLSTYERCKIRVSKSGYWSSGSWKTWTRCSTNCGENAHLHHAGTGVGL